MAGTTPAGAQTVQEKHGHQDGVGRGGHVGPQQGGGQQVSRPGEQFQGHFGAAIALFGALAQVTAVGRDQGDFGGREKPFQDHQGNTEDENSVDHGVP